jgi:hypothetical protein
VDVPAFDEHALFHAIDIHEDFFRDAARQRITILVHVGSRFSWIAPVFQNTCQNKYT